MTTTSFSLAIVGSIRKFYRVQGSGFRVQGSGFGVRGSLLKESRIEGQRQEIGELMPTRFLPQVREDDLEIAAELPQDLPARAARRRRRLGVGHDRDAREA